MALTYDPAAVRTRPGSYVLQVALVSAVYFGGAKLGLNLAVGHGVITPVWPPTGIAIAALLLLGPRVWPAVAIGAFPGTRRAASRSGSPPGSPSGTRSRRSWPSTCSAGSPSGSPSSAFRTWSGSPARRPSRAAVAATNGVTVLALADSAAASPYGSRWLLWWLGDATGALLVAPLILVWATRPPLRFSGQAPRRGRRRARGAGRPRPRSSSSAGSGATPTSSSRFSSGPPSASLSSAR